MEAFQYINERIVANISNKVLRRYAKHLAIHMKSTSCCGLHGIYAFGRSSRVYGEIGLMNIVYTSREKASSCAIVTISIAKYVVNTQTNKNAYRHVFIKMSRQINI